MSSYILVSINLATHDDENQIMKVVDVRGLARIQDEFYVIDTWERVWIQSTYLDARHLPSWYFCTSYMHSLLEYVQTITSELLPLACFGTVALSFLS